jgi:hypothetical protein
VRDAIVQLGELGRIPPSRVSDEVAGDPANALEWAASGVAREDAVRVGRIGIEVDVGGAEAGGSLRDGGKLLRGDGAEGGGLCGSC